MSYERAKQLISGTIPPWQKVFDSAMSMGAAPLLPQSMEELKDVPNVAASLGSDFTTIPFTDIGPRKFMDVPEPQTQYGQDIRMAGDIAPLVMGGAAGIQGIDDLIRNMEIQKVQKIQKAFGPWVKKYTGEYGKALRGGIKGVLKDPKYAGGKLLKEVQRTFNPLRRSDSYQDLPSKTRIAIDKIYGVDKLGNPTTNPREILNATNRLRKSSQASKFDETGKLVRETGNKLKKIVKDKSPEFAKVDREYGEFSGVRDVMEKFKPGNKGQGVFSTQSGTRILRDINKRQPGDIKAMERFGNETGINIVGPAKLAAGVRGIGNLIKKSVPWAGGGGAGYLLAKKLLGGQSSYQNYGN